MGRGCRYTEQGTARWVPLPLIWALDSALGPSGQGEVPGRPRHSRPPGGQRGAEEAARSSALGLTPSWILTRENQFLGLEVSPGDRTLLPSSPEVYGFLTPAVAFRHSLPSCDRTGDGGPQTEQAGQWGTLSECLGPEPTHDPLVSSPEASVVSQVPGGGGRLAGAASPQRLAYREDTAGGQGVAGAGAGSATHQLCDARLRHISASTCSSVKWEGGHRPQWVGSEQQDTVKCAGSTSCAVTII